MDEQPIRLLLVDDHKVVRLGLEALFRSVRGVTVVGQADTVESAVSEARRCAPDVVLLDVRLPDGSGVDACREIRSMRPETEVIMLTSYDDADALMNSIIAGASGYLLKHAVPERLIEAVRCVAQGGSLLDPSSTRTVLGWLQRVASQPQGGPLSDLSEHERTILPLIAAGETNRQIAAKLYLSEYTVKAYVSNILHKLGVSRRAGIAAFIAQQKSMH